MRASQLAVRANPELSWYFTSGISLRPQELRLTLGLWLDSKILLLLTALCLMRLTCNKARASHCKGTAIGPTIGVGEATKDDVSAGRYFLDVGAQAKDFTSFRSRLALSVLLPCFLVVTESTCHLEGQVPLGQ